MEITRENIKGIRIEKLTLDSKKFGPLTFDNANKKLEKIQRWILEFDSLNYEEELPSNAVSDIDNHIQQFLEQLTWLQNFDIAQSTNAKQEHDDYEGRVDNFYNNFTNLALKYLVYLRQEADHKSKDKKTLQKEQKELIQLKRQYEDLLEQAIKEREKTLKETKKIEEAKGERAAVSFGKHFESQAGDYAKDARKWLVNRDKFFLRISQLVVINLLIYLFLFVTNILNRWPFLEPKQFFSIEYGLVNFALLSLLSYGISFASRNYNVNSNLLAVNLHRKNVAETIKDFSDSGLKEEDRSKILEQGINSMFKHLPIGYLPKVESRDNGPLSSIVDTILRRD